MKLTNDQDRLSYKNVWVLAEMTNEGQLHSATFELLGAARNLAKELNCEVWAIALGSDLTEISKLIPFGADKVLAVEDERLQNFQDELECAILEHLVQKYRPDILLGSATIKGRALIPRLASQLYTGLTADCTELSIDPQTGELLQTRPAFGGNIMATIRSGGFRPQMATVRPKVMKPIARDDTRQGEILREEVVVSADLRVKQIIETVTVEDGALNLSDARIIVSGGRAMKGPEGFQLLKSLADRLGGAVGASRAAVDNGWIAYPHQVGQTGQTVQADLYIACGISGQIQHLIGMQSCKTIIAIDIDDTTPMMQIADIAVKGDLFEILPALISELDKVGEHREL